VDCRRTNAAALSAGLRDIPGVQVPAELPGRSHVWHQFTVLLSADADVSRDEVAAGLLERGVGAGIYYPRPVYDYGCYRDHPRVLIEPVPIAESVASRCLSLPVHQHLTPAEIEQIIEAVGAVMAR